MDSKSLRVGAVSSLADMGRSYWLLARNLCSVQNTQERAV